MNKPIFPTLRMLLGDSNITAHSSSYHYRNTSLATEHIRELRSLIHYLIHTQRHEIHKWNFDDRFATCYGSTNGNSYLTLFGYWRVLHPAITKLLPHSCRCAKLTTIRANIICH